MRSFLTTVSVVFIAAAISRADTLEKTNGQKLEGRVLAETADVVSFEVNSGGISFTQKIPRAQIRSIQKEVREGPGYCAIPLVGDIGGEVKAVAVKQLRE